MKKIFIIIICVIITIVAIAFLRTTTRVEENSTDIIYEDNSSAEENNSVVKKDNVNANLPETTKLKFGVEGEPQERDAKLYKSTSGFNIYILEGYSTKELSQGTTRIQMDFDPDYYVDITKLSNKTEHNQWAQETNNKLNEYVNNQNEIHQIDPKEHFDEYFHDAYYYIVASIANKGDIIFMLDSVGETLLEYKISMPIKEASEGVGPSLWAMLKSIT